MSSAGASGEEFEVHNSASIARAFVRLQRRAAREGRGVEVLEAAKEMYERIRTSAREFGEPLYRLPALRMEIRCAVIRPLCA